MISTPYTSGRNICYAIMGSIDKLFHRQTKLIVLSYHSISDDGWRFSTKYIHFKEQMAYLRERYMPIKLSEIAQLLSGEKEIQYPSFAVTFDDGYADCMEVVKLCDGFGIVPTVFVLSNPEQVDRTIVATQKTFLTDEQIRFLFSQGWEIGSHGATHRYLSELSADELKQEVVGSKQIIEQIIGSSVTSFSYAKGVYNQIVIKTVKEAGYQIAVSMDDSVTIESKNRYILPRIGVDGTHTFSQFKQTISPSVILLRKMVKQSPLKKYV